MKNRTQAKGKKSYKVAGIVVGLLLVVKILDYNGSVDSKPSYPGYEMSELGNYADLEEIYQGNISLQEENFLFYQTGLGRVGVEGVRKQCDSFSEFLEELQTYQKQFFKGDNEKKIVELKTGDVLVSMSQRLCYYPHGHAAIVIDGEKNTILEARSYQAGSCVCTLSKWAKLSSFAVLRLKEEVVRSFVEQGVENPAKSAALYADENLEGLKYSLLKDIRYNDENPPQYTQCAHLVWYAYYAVGLDIDKNRGLIVRPKDFLKSDVFDVVQIFGMDLEEVLELRNE